MNPVLQQLKDIHLPTAIHYGLLAPGWILLFSMLLMVCIALCIKTYRRYRRHNAIRYALKQLAQLKKLAEQPDAINTIALEISTLLRRTALHYFRREDIAGLAGNAWLTFLNHSSCSTEFTSEAGKLLLDAPYRPLCQDDVMLLFPLAQSWLYAIRKEH